MSKKNLFPLLGLVGLAFAALACGSIVENVAENAAAGLQETLDAGVATIESGATEFAPTINAGLTEAAGTIEAASTELGPTLEAEMTAAVATAEAAGVDVEGVQETAAAGIDDVAATAAGIGENTTVEEDGTVRQWALEASATSQFGDDSWAAFQAAGAPDTTECGDIPTAWASESSTGVDTLTLTYALPIIPQEINIYETYNPGQITLVTVTTVTGEEITVYEGAPAITEECPRVFTVPVSGVTQPVMTVSITVDQTNGSWNEIDAVELVGGAGE